MEIFETRLDTYMGDYTVPVGNLLQWGRWTCCSLTVPSNPRSSMILGYLYVHTHTYFHVLFCLTYFSRVICAQYSALIFYILHPSHTQILNFENAVIYHD